ncbi:MAG: hypothetical protein U9N09_00635 [Euryarchaeota archaeon]|nr:hypothetical protein [Euryarchaeota archaeon]
MKQIKEGHDMNITKTTLATLLIIVALTSLAASLPADELRASQHRNDTYMPHTATAAGLPDKLSPGFTFSKNFYDVYGQPNLIASIVGDEKFDRGDEVTLTIDLTNRGVVLGYESDRMPDDDEEIDLARMELGYELQQVNAIGITAMLAAPEESPIDVKSGPQQAGSIKGDKGARKTVRFNIEIDENAPAGTYPLVLATSYMYQKNAQVSGNVSESRADVNLWYDILNQTQVLYITVEKLADFEVTNVSSDLRAGEDDRVLSITYLNTGEETATEAVARVSVTDPFSSTDDQAYLGTLAPGESVTGIFVLDTDSNAAIKPYGTDTEIRFTDSTGESKISESMTATVTIAPLIPTSEKVKPYILPAVLFMLLVLVATGVRYYLRNVAGNRNAPTTDEPDD